MKSVGRASRVKSIRPLTKVCVSRQVTAAEKEAAVIILAWQSALTSQYVLNGSAQVYAQSIPKPDLVPSITSGVHHCVCSSLRLDHVAAVRANAEQIRSTLAGVKNRARNE